MLKFRTRVSFKMLFIPNQVKRSSKKKDVTTKYVVYDKAVQQTAVKKKEEIKTKYSVELT